MCPPCAGRRTQAGDATDQWRCWWNAATVCATQWRSPASVGWLSWIVDVDRPSVEGHPKQSNRLDSSPGSLGATLLGLMNVTFSRRTSLCSWQYATAHRLGTCCSVQKANIFIDALTGAQQSQKTGKSGPTHEPRYRASAKISFIIAIQPFYGCQ